VLSQRRRSSAGGTNAPRRIEKPPRLDRAASLQYNFEVLLVTPLASTARPVMVQFAETFQLARNSAETTTLFHRVFHSFC
jgi:hypothetical protein